MHCACASWPGSKFIKIISTKGCGIFEANMLWLSRALGEAPLTSLVLLLLIALGLSLNLCDEGDCVNKTDLEICRPFSSSNKTPLYLMGFFPCNNRVRARGLTVAAQMAIRAVEKNNSILSNYSMRLSFNNTKVSLKYARGLYSVQTLTAGIAAAEGHLMLILGLG